MLKVVVFDDSLGGVSVADYLQNELSVVDVQYVTDWQDAPYVHKTVSEICQLVDKSLAEYIGKVDLIILGGYTVALALNYLRMRYHEQKFVSVGVNYYRVLKSANYPHCITVIMDQTLLDTPLGDELKHNLPNAMLAIPDSEGWEDQADAGELSAHILRSDLEMYFELSRPPKTNLKEFSKLPLLEAIPLERQAALSPNPAPHSHPTAELIPSDVVLLLNTSFWDVKNNFEQVFGYKTRVFDFRQKLLHDTCLALDLLGVDGCRNK